MQVRNVPNILLIDTNTTHFNEVTPIYPIGLDYLQGALRQVGFTNTQILDLREAGGNLVNFNQRETKSLTAIAQKVGETRWDIIGIGIRNIDSTCSPEATRPELDYYLPQIRTYVDCVRAANGNQAHIILGGSGFSMMPEEILDYLEGDYYGVVGPGEVALPRLIADLLDDKPRHRIYGGASEIKIGKLQNLDLLEKYEHLSQNISAVGVRTKNGCGQHCGYCPYPSISGSEVITKDIDDVIDEVRILRKTGFSSFMFADDVFNVPLEHAKEILRAMLSTQEIPKNWHAYVDPKEIDEELLELIVETNGWSCYPNIEQSQGRAVIFPFSIESGCDRILRNIGKGFTTEDIKRSVMAFDSVKRSYRQRAGISAFSTVFYLLLGYLGEDEESVKESCEFVNEILPDWLSIQVGVRIYLHTPLAQKTRGILWHEPKDLLTPTFVPFDKAEIKGWLAKYLNPTYGIIEEMGNVIYLSRRDSLCI